MPKSIQEYLKEPYARILIPDEQGGYAAEILELPGCFAEGETADEAMQALDSAAESWIQAALDQGQEIPLPFMNQGYSGKIALRLSRSLHRKAAQFAERDGTSINQFLMSAIAARVGSEEFYEHLVAQLLKKLEDKLFVAVNRVTNIAFVNIRASEFATTAEQPLQSPLTHWQVTRTAKTSTDIVATVLEVASNG